MNNTIELLEQIIEDVAALNENGDRDLFIARMIANAHDAELIIDSLKCSNNNG